MQPHAFDPARGEYGDKAGPRWPRSAGRTAVECWNPGLFGTTSLPIHVAHCPLARSRPGLFGISIPPANGPAGLGW